VHSGRQKNITAERVRTGKQQTIPLPDPIDARAKDTDNQKIIQEEAVRAVCKRKAKLYNALKMKPIKEGTGDSRSN
jgi:hypothetical protein